MSRRALQAAALLVPAVTLGLWEYVRHSLLDPVLPTGWGNIVSALIVAVTTFWFVKAFARLLTSQIRETAAMREQAAIMGERQRIARDMHDEVAQALFYIDVKLAELEQLHAEGQIAAARAVVAPLRRHVSDTAAAVRTVVANLHNHDVAESLPDIIRRLASAFPQRGRAAVSVAVQGQFHVPAPVTTQLAAIVQEALTNADKHADARSIRVCAHGERDRLSLLVRDDGCGFDPDGDLRGHGLQIMAERAALAGGRLRIDSEAGRGTTVEVEVVL